MQYKGLEFASNTACSDDNGVYDALIYYLSPSGMTGHVFHEQLSGEALPDFVDPVSSIRWALDNADARRQAEIIPGFDRQRVAAATIVRLCISTEHTVPPYQSPYSNRRFEIVSNIFVAQDGAEPEEVHSSQSDLCDDNGFGTVRLPIAGAGSSGSRAEHGLLLPHCKPPGEKPEFSGCIRLQAPGPRHHTVYGVMRGDEAVVRPAEL
jgi:hypothetical protein